MPVLITDGCRVAHYITEFSCVITRHSLSSHLSPSPLAQLHVSSFNVLLLKHLSKSLWHALLFLWIQSHASVFQSPVISRSPIYSQVMGMDSGSSIYFQLRQMVFSELIEVRFANILQRWFKITVTPHICCWYHSICSFWQSDQSSTWTIYGIVSIHHSQ